jgi:tetratricopeptide (TPR) repeat protein
MDIAILQQQAALCCTQGQYEAAVQLYELAIETDPSLKRNYWHLGLVWLLQGEVEHAQAVWLAVLAEATLEEAECLLQELIEVLQQAAQDVATPPHVAVQIYLQLLELAATPEVYQQLGQAYALTGDLDAAIAHWQKAIDLRPQWAQVYCAQAEVWQRLEEYESAISAYRQAIALQPDGVATRHQLGLCLMQQRCWSEAIVQLRLVVQQQPDCAPAWADLGIALLWQTQIQEAIHCLRRMVQLRSDFVEDYCQWVYRLQSEHRASQILQENAAVLSALQNQAIAAAYLPLARLLARNGDWTVAIALYQHAIQLQPTNGLAYLELGQTFSQTQHWQQAIAIYQQLLQLHPDWAMVHLGLGQAWLKLQHRQQAIAALQAAIALEPEQGTAWYSLGLAWAAIENWTEAIACYRKVLTLQPEAIEAYCQLGVALVNQGQTLEAFSCFQIALSLQPGIADWLDQLLARQIASEKAEFELIRQRVQTELLSQPPRQVCWSTWEWAIAANHYCKDLSIKPSNHDTIHYQPIHPKQTISLTLPKTLDQTVHFSFRLGHQINVPASFVVTLPHGQFWLDPDQTSMAILTGDNVLLRDLSPQFPLYTPDHPANMSQPHWLLTVKQLSAPQWIDGTIAVLAGLSNRMYFHWMCDVLPRVELLRHQGSIEAIDRFLVNATLPFQRETLELLGISTQHILEVEQQHYIQAGTLIIPSFSGNPAWMSKFACHFLRRSFLQHLLKPVIHSPKRLYVSRQSTATRRILNEQQLIDQLVSLGFKPVALETLSVVEQITLFANAEVVIAPHGSGLTNILFCKPETTIIELFSPNYVYPCYWYLANLVELNYSYLIGEMPEGSSLHKLLHANPRTEDIWVNPKQLLHLLKIAGVLDG